MSHQWMNRTILRKLPRAASVRRGICLVFLLAAVTILVLLQALQLPVSISLDSRRGRQAINLTKLAHEERPTFSMPKRPIGPVSSVCYGPDSSCLAGLLLSPSPKLATGDGYRIPTIVHLLCIEPPSRQRLASISAFLFDWHRLHRNWTYVLWTRDEVQRLLKVFYARYVPLVEASPQLLTHLAPLLIVQKYGGVMVNTDNRPTRSVDPLRRLPAVFDIDGRWPHSTVNPGLFMAAPGHPFVQYCTDQTLHRRTSHGGLTRLMLDYAAAFPLTERPEQSLHLAPLASPSDRHRDIERGGGSNEVSSGTTSSSSGSGGSGSDGNDTSGSLRLLLRHCDKLNGLRSSDSQAMSPLRIGCSELRELRSFLETGGGAFVRVGAPDGAEAPSRTMRPDELASIFPLLNVGLKRAWEMFR